MYRNSVITVLALSALIASSCGEPSVEQPSARRQSPVSVRTLPVQTSEVATQFEAPGTVRAAVSTVVSAKVPGRIESLALLEGDRVRRDQILAEIDSRDAVIRLRGAEAQLAEAMEAQQELERNIRAAEAAVKAAVSNRDLARSTLDRYTMLRDRKSVSPQEFDEVRARLNGAEAAVEQASESLAAAEARRAQLRARIEQSRAAVDAAQVALADHRVTAPIDGVVTEKHAEAGMLASPGMPLLAIEDTSRYELEVAIEEARVSAIRTGQQATVQIGALERTFTGRVARILPLGDPASRTYTVRIELPRAQGQSPLRSGFFGRAIFAAGQKTAVLIPRSALIDRGELSGVYVVADGIAVFRIVRVGQDYDDQLEVLSGLKEGERFVDSPDAAVRDGVPVVESTP